MLNFLDNIYSKIIDRNQLLSSIRFYSIQRVIIRTAANILLPFYFKLTERSPNAQLDNCVKSQDRLIVSLTTFPLRANRVWLSIETLLRQTHKPDLIILWLSKDQFKSINDLPKNLLKLQKRGLKIRFCEKNLRSHKKYFYALREFTEDYLITVDDDIFYNSTMIEQLVKLNKIHPHSICCNRANLVKMADGKLLPYSKWSETEGYIPPSFDIFQTSGGGALFPPKSLHSEVLNDEVFLRICLNADDVWLNIMSRLNRTKIARTSYHRTFLPVISLNNKHLFTSNLIQGGNDTQLQEVRNHYICKLGVDAFANPNADL